MGSFASGWAQVGSVTINGNQNVSGGSTWTYSIIGTSCSSANWIVNGGTITSQYNISVTVQWNVSSGNGSVQVSSYGCSPTPESRTGFLNVTRTAPLITISGRITSENGQGLAGVNVAGTTTDTNGYYSLTVSNGYTGTHVPSRTGYTFSPTNRNYSNITTSQINQDFVVLCQPEYVDLILVFDPYTGSFTTFNYLGNLLTGVAYTITIKLKNGVVQSYTAYGLPKCFEAGSITTSSEIASVCMTNTQSGRIFGNCN
jgi:hypothetical protein